MLLEDKLYNLLFPIKQFITFLLLYTRVPIRLMATINTKTTTTMTTMAAMIAACAIIRKDAGFKHNMNIKCNK